MAKIDIVQIAKVLNISKSTVSRAFRDSADINPKTKERILKLAKELNYQPNYYASNLKEQKSKTIAIVLPELANNYFTQIIQGAEREAKKQGYHILIFVTDDDISKERDFIRSLASGRVDGVIMSVSGESTDHSYLESINYDHLPIVLFDRIYDDINLPKIVTDDYESSFMATEHLIQSGCQRIAYFVINKELSIGKTRLQGYEDALKKYKIPLRKRLIVDCSNSYEENNEIIETAILKQKPDGILASVERLAFSTYYVCQRIGVKIPEDIKIIAFSSLEIAGLLNPPLSVVRQPAFQIGERAAATLLKQLTGETLQENEKFVTMHSDLVIKDSSRG